MKPHTSSLLLGVRNCVRHQYRDVTMLWHDIEIWFWELRQLFFLQFSQTSKCTTYAMKYAHGCVLQSLVVLGFLLFYSDHGFVIFPSRFRQGEFQSYDRTCTSNELLKNIGKPDLYEATTKHNKTRTTRIISWRDYMFCGMRCKIYYLANLFTFSIMWISLTVGMNYCWCYFGVWFLYAWNHQAIQPPTPSSPAIRDDMR